MKVSLKVMLLLGVCTLSLGGCGKSDKPMPVTKANFTDYQRQVETAMKATTPKEFEETKTDPEKQKKVMYACFIKPIEEMGYSYDKTISDMSGKLLSNTLATPDSATTVMASDFLRFAKNARQIEYTHGFITKETKVLLDKVSQVFPR